MTEFVLKRSVGPQRVGTIEYSVLSGSDMVSMAHVLCSQAHLYQQPSLEPMPDGVLDRRMGVSDQKSPCGTCMQPLKVCPGHFGVVELQLPVFHVGYFRAVMTILQCICKTCSRLLLSPLEKEKLLRRVRTSGADVFARRALYKKVVGLCKKATRPRQCQYCGALNGQVRKFGALKLSHDKYKGGKDERVRSFYTEFNTAVRYNGEIASNLSRAQDDISPLRAYQLLKAIPPEECELLDMKPSCCKPESLILTHHLVPPVCIRPIVAMDSAGMTNQDDVTVRLFNIIHVNENMRDCVAKGREVKAMMEGWEYLQLLSALLINSELPSLQSQAISLGSKAGRGLCQRLKGKTGRIRGNLSGKRVDFTSRTVISPDPNLEIDQVAVPIEAAMKLTYPDVVTPHNIEKLRAAVLRGANAHPGANYLEKAGSGRKQWLKFARDLGQLARSLEVGDIVERHLCDDDICLFNRQPSLHRMSIMCHRAKIRPWRTFRFNECVCAPYNADFDGDEMNLHVPQTEEARAEAMTLMGVTRNLITPCNGNPLIAATQDFLTAAFLLSNKDRFYDRSMFCQFCMWATEGASVTLPPPAIVKPMELWTGKQVLSVLIRESLASPVIVNFETTAKTYTGNSSYSPKHMCHEDGYVVVRNSELLCGTFDKKSIGSGTKDNLFHVLLRDFSPKVAASRMCRLSKLCGRWLGTHGFSIGVTDVWPSDTLVAEKQRLVSSGYAECDNFVKQLENGSLAPQPGFTKEQTLEAKMNGALSRVREKAGSACMSQLHHLNSPLIMAKCGSKGGQLNISQMTACVGQQTIMGARIPNGFIDRTLPHFKVHEKSPVAKGFVRNSFFSGLTPTEFFFHTMAGREGLVDTAVKTADTGYMQRRLMKALEDMTVHYDNTVRNSEGTMMQLVYGDDGLDPSDMESNNTPVSFAHIHAHALASAPWRPCSDPSDSQERSLDDTELVRAVVAMMGSAEFTANATNMVTRDLLRFFFGTEMESLYRRIQAHSTHTEIDDDDVILPSVAAKVLSMRRVVEDKKKKREEKRRGQEQEIVDYKGGLLPALTKELEAGALTADLSYGGLLGKIKAARKGFLGSTVSEGGSDPAWLGPVMANTVSMTERQLKIFFDMLNTKLRRARIQPGTPVGAIAGQSIGEPATQMTLKTFHFAGVATMNITLGVPRIKEIINATRVISTPIITAKLVAAHDIRAARVVKARVEKTTLGEICRYIKQVYSPDGCHLNVRLDDKAIEALQMDVTSYTVRDAILRVTRTKLKPQHVLCPGMYQLQVHPPAGTKESLFFGLQSLRVLLPTVIISGIPTISRSVINEVPTKKKNCKKYVMMAEGYDLRSVMVTPGVQGEKTMSNHIIEMEEVLGIEAARQSIIEQIRVTMEHHGIAVDIRHITLLADVMTFKGTILGITRHGVAKMRESVMTLASFETPTDHLFDAAIHGRMDTICGVSDSVIVGNPITVGTGLFQVFRHTRVRSTLPKPKPTLLSSRKFPATVPSLAYS